MLNTISERGCEYCDIANECHLLSLNSKSVCVQSITVISSHPECRNARNVERGARRSELGAQGTRTRRGGVHSGDDIENPDTEYRDQGSRTLLALLGQMTDW